MTARKNMNTHKNIGLNLKVTENTFLFFRHLIELNVALISGTCEFNLKIKI